MLLLGIPELSLVAYASAEGLFAIGGEVVLADPVLTDDGGVRHQSSSGTTTNRGRTGVRSGSMSAARSCSSAMVFCRLRNGRCWMRGGAAWCQARVRSCHVGARRAVR